MKTEGSSYGPAETIELPTFGLQNRGSCEAMVCVGVGLATFIGIVTHSGQGSLVARGLQMPSAAEPALVLGHSTVGAGQKKVARERFPFTQERVRASSLPP